MTAEKQEPPDKANTEIPQVIVQQAEAAAIAAQEDDDEGHWARTRVSMDSLNTSVYEDSIASVDTTAIDEPQRSTQEAAAQEVPPPDIPPPAYGEHLGEINDHQEDLDTKAVVISDGRVDIDIDQHSRRITTLLAPVLRHEEELAKEEEPPPPAYIPPSLGGSDGLPPPPPMNVVIQVVGSRGDVQPFIALGKVLKETYGHRVRIATHLNFRQFVTENGLEFFNIGGDPTKLMAFMVKNPGLMPDLDAMGSGDIGSRRNEIREILRGCWRSCYEAGEGLGPQATDASIEEWASNPTTLSEDENRPFVIDALIANPPSFAHIHVAEKLGIPLHIMFTMPYSPTQAFPHPLANIRSSNAEESLTNYMSYTLIEMLTWQGLGDVINTFRSSVLGLDEITTFSAQILQRLKIPHTYCWSPALIPKPRDWRQHINIAGFYFLDTATSYTPPPDLKAFLDAGPPPVYIGFGSIVLDNPNAMTELLFEAVRRTGQRALISQGWGGLAADELGKPDEVFMLGNCPHDWLFKRVSCVVHHGGAGTTAAGIRAGTPTAIVPFFGDQPFWGAMIARAGAGPTPIPQKKLTPECLVEAIEFCLKPQTQERARELAQKMAQERGTDKGAQYFHQYLNTDELRCSLAPSRAAVWRVKKTQIRLSALAACTLANAGILDFKNLKLYRPREYETDPGPVDPITGGAGAIIGTVGAVMGGVMTLPLDKYKKAQAKKAKKQPEIKRSVTTSELPDHSDGKAPLSPSVSGESDSTVTATAESVRSDSQSARSGYSTPATTTSTFNLEESLAKLGTSTSTPALSRTRSTQEYVSNTKSSIASSSKTKSSLANSFLDPNGPLETVTTTGKGVLKILEAGFKSPMDFTDNLARGFHNAPKLYGDDTVRKKPKITDLKSGLRAASRGFGLGMYDGITGLVTQPVSGLKKEGGAGFIKGIGKGVGGLVLKPGAAIFGIPGSTMRGLYREINNLLGSSVQNYIIAARTAQGYEDWNESTPEERDDIIKRYLRANRNPNASLASPLSPASPPSQRPQPVVHETIFEQPMPGSFDSRSATPRGQETGTQRNDSNPEESLHLRHADDYVEELPDEEESTPHAEDENDDDLKRAISASLAEPRDEDLERAIAASQQDAQARSVRDSTIRYSQPPPAYEESSAGSEIQPDVKTGHERSEEEIVMEYVRKQSLLEQQHRAAAAGGSNEAGPSNTSNDEDEELKRVLELSMRDQGGRR